MRTVALFFCLSLCACDRAGPTIQRNTIPAFVVNQFDTPLDVGQVKLKILSGVQYPLLRRNGFYLTHGFKSDDGSSVDFTAEGNNLFTLFGTEFFRDPANAKDVYLHSHFTVMSSYYHAAGKSLHYHAEFAVRLTPDSKAGTTVSIRALNPAVYNGTEFNGHVMGYIPMRVAVEASPLDEYRMLVCVAHALGTELPTLER